MSQPPTPVKVVDAGPAYDITPQPAPPAGPPGALALYRAFRRRWPLALGGGLLLAAAAAAAVYAAVPPAKYTAVGLLRVQMFRPRILFDTKEQEAEFQVFQKSQTTLIRTRYVLEAVLGDPGVARLETIREVTARQQDPIDWLEKQVTVDFPNKSEFLQIAVSGDRPKDVEVITNKIIDVYMKYAVDTEDVDRKARVETLRKLWEDYQEKLRGMRGSLKKLALAAGSDDRQTLSIKSQFAQEALAQADAERVKNKAELNRLLARVAGLEAGRAAAAAAAAGGGVAHREVTESELDALVDTDGESKTIRDSMQSSRAAYEKARRLTTRNPSDPAARAASDRYNAAKAALAGRRKQLRAALARRAGGEADPDPGRELEQVKREVLVYKQFDQDMVKEVDQRRKEMRALNENTLDLQTEQDEIALLAETAKKVGTEVESMEVEIRAPARIKVIDRAKAPVVMDNMKKLRASGTAAVGAFAFVLAGVTFWETRARRVNSSDEVVQGLGFRLVGSLPSPQAPARRRPPAAAGRAYGNPWQSKLVESVDATRTMLLHAARADALRVVMITSASAGEGKTTLACHLTASLARAGRKTLLIDCDLRRPAAHRLFDQPSGPGVSELLRGEVALDDVIRSTAAADLHMIPAGACDAQAVQSLAQGGLQPVFDDLRARYDFIIVDSAPVLPVVDSLIISQHADAVIFSILRDVSRIPAVQDARDRLSALGVRILGAVVSGMPGPDYSSRYGPVAAGQGVSAADQG